MPKFIPLRLFEGQQVVKLEREPTQVAAARGSFLVATSDGGVYAISDGESYAVLHRFRALCAPLAGLFYIESTDCVVTLEPERDKSPILVVRVYSGWRGGAGGESVRSRAALEVCTLPTRSSVRHVAVCRQSGCILTARDGELELWRHRRDEAGRSSVRSLLRMGVPDGVCDVAVHGVYLAYATHHEALVFRAKLEETDSGAVQQSAGVGSSAGAVRMSRSSAGNFRAVDDEQVVRCAFPAERAHEQPLITVGDNPGLLVLPSLGASCFSQNRSGDADVAFSSASTAAAFMAGGAQAGDGDSGPRRTEELGPLPDINHRARGGDEGVVLREFMLMLHVRVDEAADADSPARVSLFPEHVVRDEHGEVRPLNPQTPYGRLFGSQDPRAPGARVSGALPPRTVMEDASESAAAARDGDGEVLCMYTCGLGGFLYLASSPGRLADYSFSGDVGGVAVGGGLMAALTGSEQLEMWTLRGSEASMYSYPGPIIGGMEHVMGLEQAVMVGSSIVLLSRQRGEASPAWNIYVLQRTAMTDVIDQMLGMVDGRDDDEYAYQILVEAYFLSRARLSELHVLQAEAAQSDSDAAKAGQRPPMTPKRGEGVGAVMTPEVEETAAEAVRKSRRRTMSALQQKRGREEIAANDVKGPDLALKMSLQLEVKTFRSLLRRIAFLLGEHYVRSFDFMQAAKCFATAQSTLGQVIASFGSSEQVGPALVRYLERILFDGARAELVADQTPELATRVMRCYHTFAPHRLPSLVLDSGLRDFDPGLAQRWLRELLNGMSTQPVDEHYASFALTLLSLQVGDGVDAAYETMRTIPFDRLVQYGVDKHDMIIPYAASDQVSIAALEALRTDSGALDALDALAVVLARHCASHPLPLLGLELRRKAPWALLEILARLGDRVPMTAALLVLIAGAATPGAETADDLLVLACYMEFALRFRATDEVLPTRDVAFLLISIYASLIRLNSRTAPRAIDATAPGAAPWLAFHAEYGVEGVPRWVQRLAQSLCRWVELDGGAPDEVVTAVWERREVATYLSKTCALLAGATPIDRVRVGRAMAPDGSAPLPEHLRMLCELLCLPGCGRMEEACHIVLERAGAHLCAFAVYFCAEVADWQHVLSVALRYADAAVADGMEAGEVQLRRRRVEAILAHLAGELAPLDLVEMLPDNGRLVFFLPYIEQSYRHEASKSVLDSAVDRVRVEL